MKAFKRLVFILRSTKVLRFFWWFLLVLLVVAVILRFIEPQIEMIGDGFWFLYAAATTIGFGDLCVVTPLGRILTILVSMMGILVVAMIPGVVVSYYTEFIRRHQEETVSVFMEKLEHLPELSKEELAELSEKIKKMRTGKTVPRNER